MGYLNHLLSKKFIIQMLNCYIYEVHACKKKAEISRFERVVVIFVSEVQNACIIIGFILLNIGSIEDILYFILWNAVLTLFRIRERW